MFSENLSYIFSWLQSSCLQRSERWKAISRSLIHWSENSENASHVVFVMKIVCSRHQTHRCHAWVATNSFNEILQNVCLKESPRKQVLSFWNNKWKCSHGAFSYILFLIQVEIFSSNLYLLSIKNLSFFFSFNRFVLLALIFMPVGVKLLLFVSHRRKIVSHLRRHFNERRRFLKF